MSESRARTAQVCVPNCTTHILGLETGGKDITHASVNRCERTLGMGLAPGRQWAHSSPLPCGEGRNPHGSLMTPTGSGTHGEPAHCCLPSHLCPSPSPTFSSCCLEGSLPRSLLHSLPPFLPAPGPTAGALFENDTPIPPKPLALPCLSLKHSPRQLPLRSPS